jgi:hypothetical protein
MTSKTDKSLLEVWEMKALAYNEYINSGTKSYTEYLEKSTKEVIEKYNIKIRKKPD